MAKRWWPRYIARACAWCSGSPACSSMAPWRRCATSRASAFITTRHEQATTYMADGYARAGGGFGVALVVPGARPAQRRRGALHGVLGVVAGPGDRGADPQGDSIGKDIGLLHEVNDQLDAITPVTKWRKRVLEVGRHPRRRPRGDPPAQDGPSATGRPRDPARDPGGRGRGQLLAGAGRAPAGAVAEIERAARACSRRGTRSSYAGGGVNLSGAHEALAAVAEHLQAGVVSPPRARAR